MSRMYRLPSGREVPSVTTILNAIPKPFLAYWGQRKVAEAAYDEHMWRDLPRDEAVQYLKESPYRLTEKAAEKGTAVHLAAETGEWAEVPEFEAGYTAFLRDVQPQYLWREEAVWDTQVGYAGRFDAVGRIPEMGVVLLDFKTSPRVYASHHLQAAAYVHASHAPWGFYPPESAAVVRIGSEGDYDVTPLDVSIDQFDVFCALRTVYEWQVRTGEVRTPKGVVEL